MALPRSWRENLCSRLSGLNGRSTRPNDGAGFVEGMARGKSLSSQENLQNRRASTKSKELEGFSLAKVARGHWQSTTMPVEPMTDTREIPSLAVAPKATTLQDHHINVGQNVSRKVEQGVALVLEQPTAMAIFTRIGAIHHKVRDQKQRNPNH